MKAKGEAGEHLCTNEPYGFQKDESNPKQWIVDEAADQVVKHIFKLFLEGCGPSQIVRILEADKVLTPATHWQAQGKTTNQPTPENPHRWIARTIADTKREIAAKRRQLTQDERRKEELDRLFKRIYEDNASGKISDSRFQMLSDDYQQEQAELSKRLLQLDAEITQQEEQAENIERFISKVKKYLDLDKLTPSVLNDMVKAVYVQAPDKSNGRRAQQVDISYDLVGILPVSLLDSLKSEETA